MLQGGRALLLGHPPYFRASWESAGGSPNPFHSDSPAGKWLAKNPASGGLSPRFSDPHEGKGGFGGSGAEFLSAWCLGQEIPAAESPRAIFSWNAWEAYKEIGGSGSGADILTQAFGVDRADAFFLLADISAKTVREIFPAKMGGEISLFHTGKKLPTHEQKTPQNLPLAELEEILSSALESLEGALFQSFASALSAFGDKLASLGLLAGHSAQALASVRSISKVCGAKGCGAMGADVILVAHQGADLAEWASANSLALIGTFPV